MTTRPRTVLVVGATGSIGRLVVDEAIAQGYAMRALVRDPGKARQLPASVQLVVGDVTRPGTLPAAVDGVDAVVITLGSDGPARSAPRPSTTAAFATSWPRWVPARYGSPC